MDVVGIYYFTREKSSVIFKQKSTQYFTAWHFIESILFRLLRWVRELNSSGKIDLIEFSMRVNVRTDEPSEWNEQIEGTTWGTEKKSNVFLLVTTQAFVVYRGVII